MTDNEIIKAFKCCHLESDFPNCKECPIENICDEVILTDEVSKLINRQKAKIEKLKAENEVMKTNCNSMYVSMPNMAKAERAEAIKEFVDGFKTKATVVHKTYSGKRWYEINDYDIDNLVKEMTEAETNQRKEDEGK